jgi:quercetin 2,3-dioxygenase
MTAGRGIIHGENVATKGKVRLLQLWLTLPKSQRWAMPGFQDVHGHSIPVRREPGVEIRLYSGASGGLRAPTHNQVPVTIAEIAMNPRARVEQDIPTSYNGFVYVIRGALEIGEDGARLKAGQVGWLDRPQGEGNSVLRIMADEEGARVVLYAGQPQGDHCFLRAVHRRFEGRHRETLRRVPGWAVRSAERARTPSPALKRRGSSLRPGG